MLRYLPRKTVVQLGYIYTACLRFGYFPELWNAAKVLALPMPGRKPKLPSSYRPISLLPSLSKIMEKVVLNRLKSHENIHGQLIPQQFGFRSNHSTVSQLHRLTDRISTGFNWNKSTGMVLLDIEKAFDTVWHDGLIHKLSTYPKIRKTQIHIQQSKSSQYRVEAGVPQGSILGPRLFLYYVNDIPEDRATKTALFADDLCRIYCSSWQPKLISSCLQSRLSILENYFKSWKIKINPSKTQSILFSKRSKFSKYSLRLKMYKTEIRQTPSVEYLGVTLQRQLNWTQNANKRLVLGNASIKGLYPLLNTRSKFDERLKHRLHKTCIRPVLTYASPISVHVAPTQIAKMQRFQNRCLRTISKKPKKFSSEALHLETGHPTILNFIQTTAKSFFQNSRQNPFLEISELGRFNPSALLFRKNHRMPHDVDCS